MAIPFPSSSSPGLVGHDGGGRLINAMSQRLEGSLKGAKAIYRAPGLRPSFETATPVFRGALTVNDGLYLIQRNAAYYITKSGATFTTTFLGNIPGGKPVTLARNNFAPTPDVICVHEYGQTLLTPTTATLFIDPDLPTPNSVTFFDGYFVWTIPDGRFFVSGINGTDVSALDFATAETLPDGLLRAVRRGREVILFGQQSTEYWNNAANPVGMPLGRVTATRGGLIGSYAVTGFEDGLPANTPIFIVGPDSTVQAITGYQSAVVSSMDVQRAIEADPNRGDIALASYVANGLVFVVLTLTNATWVLDTSTGDWHERASLNASRWRANGCFQAFGAWLAGDRDSGAIFMIDPSYYREGNDALPWFAESGPGKQFPNRIGVERVDFDFASGVGYIPWADDTELKPQVAVSFSDDGGKNWSVPVLRELGRAGEFNQSVRINRQGLTGPKGRRYRLVITDPVHCPLIGGDMTIEGRSP